MSADDTLELQTDTDLRWGMRERSRDRAFQVSLVAALVLHSMFFIGLIKSPRREIGSDNGRADALAVSFMTEKEFQRETGVTAVDPPQPPGNPSPAPAPAQPKPPTPQPVKPAEAQPEKQPPAVEPETPPEAKPEPQPEPVETPSLKPAVPEPSLEAAEAPEPKQAEAEKLDAKSLEAALPDLLALDKPSAAQRKPEPTEAATSKKGAAAAKKARSKKAEKKTAALDLSLPPEAFQGVTAGRASAGMARPPGITKSGWNDDFARGVIRALQATMPQLSNTLGRVTVRIVLTLDGEVASVKVVTPSQINDLDQSVLFAVKQTSFPFPPPRATDVDRTFMVTYIYK